MIGQIGPLGPPGPSGNVLGTLPLVNECKYNNGLCTQVCVDTYDSYYCTCRSGYRLGYTNYFCPGATLCSFARANLVFIVDSSRDICGADSQCSDWSSIRDFINGIVDQLSIGAGLVRVGLIRFGALTAQSIFTMNDQQGQNRNRLRSAISGLSYVTGGRGSGNLADALREAREDQFTTNDGARLGVPNIAVILTASPSFLSTQVLLEIDSLRRVPVRLFAIGLYAPRMPWWAVRDLSVPPHVPNMNYFLVPDPVNLTTTMSQSVANSICLYSATDCQTRVMDVVFVVATSDSTRSVFSNIISFIVSLIEPMRIDTNVRVGLVTFGDRATVTISLNQYTSVSSLRNALNGLNFNLLQSGSGHNITGALYVMRTQAFSSLNDRSDAPNVAVLITDRSSSSGFPQTMPEALQAQCAGIKIFAIGTRLSNFNLTELQLISSPPHLQYHQWWAPSDFSTTRFDGIQVMVDNELCRPEMNAFCRYSRIGGYHCFCPWGPSDIRPMNGTNCIDINECAMHNGNCSQLCSNNIGSFACSCHTGFRMAPDKRTCVDVDECSNPSSCPTGSCVNTYGDYYCVNSAIVLRQTGEASHLKTSGGYSATVVVLSGVMSAVVVFLIVGVVILVLRLLQRHRQGKEPDHPVAVSHVSAPGFDSVRSKCSVGPETHAVAPSAE